MDYLPFSASFTNITSYLPSSADLLFAVPRLISKVTSFTGNQNSPLSLPSTPIAIEPTAADHPNANITSVFTQRLPPGSTALSQRTMLETIKNAVTLFGYTTSKWAIATFLTSILLNRTHFYASSRVPLSFRSLQIRVLLYLLPTIIFVYRIQCLLRAMRCQTSPDWSAMQYGPGWKQLDVDFAGEGGWIWRLSSALLFREPLETSCRAVGMLPVQPDAPRPSGSLALLWPLFLSLCFSQFVETLACALQGRRTVAEVGMTLFEHSVAFHEAQTTVMRGPMLDIVDLSKRQAVQTLDGQSVVLKRAALTSIANASPEVLLMALITSLSHLTSNILAIAGVRARYRLVTTTIYGIAYMATFAWSFLKFAALAANPSPEHAALAMPTVPTLCMMGFFPHIAVLVGILACGTIYLLAFLLTLISPPPGYARPTSLRQRFAVAYENLHANIHLSSVTPLTINWEEDFYTAILRVGYTVLTAASEAVFLNEGRRVNVESMTWLEKKRLQDHLTRRRKFQQSVVPVPSELCEDPFADGSGMAEATGTTGLGPDEPVNGYARERRPGQVAPPATVNGLGPSLNSGPQTRQRRGRFPLSYQFLNSILRLFIAVHARITIGILRRLRFKFRPRLLRRLAGPGPVEGQHQTARGIRSSRRTRSSGDWLLGDDLRTRASSSVDVEELARQRLQSSGYDLQGSNESEDYLTGYLYNWWTTGGKWGDVDTSGDYVPEDEEDDTTSIVSETTTADSDEWADLSDGQTTPTQSRYNRDSTPQPGEPALDLAHLSRLLDPRSMEEKEEARLLARRLRSPGIMTRSRFREEVEGDEVKVLKSSRLPIRPPKDMGLAADEEEALLEELILSRRSAASPPAEKGAGSWNTGAEGMGSEGPQCVVCQCEPRTVLVWPCGCLSLCDGCRVALAAKNYTNCVCCRTNVAAYSRLYVP
ncbi:hypothetical protein M011DRAFT_422795 [Sporormia fimetaria CBS 119925]|uniref:Ubiquitin-protein ligase-like protein n=1 Tax=Sporormia fimetaria CBS 119925 TaxID=1340428 RepID=A0A6A6VF48_9PLEO|nr:hypothetical protein M011DRAFT_422795 [Sporormia fimetaria CBS 119925]